MASAARSRSIYRSLLRELPPRPLLATPRTPVHQMIRERISAGAAKDSKGAQAAMAEAEAAQVVAYLQAQREYITLIERYNPGMVMDTEGESAADSAQGWNGFTQRVQVKVWRQGRGSG